MYTKIEAYTHLNRCCNRRIKKCLYGHLHLVHAHTVPACYNSLRSELETGSTVRDYLEKHQRDQHRERLNIQDQEWDCTWTCTAHALAHAQQNNSQHTCNDIMKGKRQYATMKQSTCTTNTLRCGIEIEGPRSRVDKRDLPENHLSVYITERRGRSLWRDWNRVWMRSCDPYNCKQRLFSQNLTIGVTP